MAEIKTVEQPVTVQGLLNLETGNEESVSFKYERIVSAAGASVQDLMKYASLTDADLAEAVVSYINSRNYSEAKSAEVGEQFLTPDVRKNIVLFLRQNSAYAEMSASDVFNRWKKAYLEGTAGAKKVLEIVKNIKALEL